MPEFFTKTIRISSVLYDKNFPPRQTCLVLTPTSDGSAVGDRVHLGYMVAVSFHKSLFQESSAFRGLVRM